MPCSKKTLLGSSGALAVCLFSLLVPSSLAARPSPQYEALEDMLYESGAFNGLVLDCARRPSRSSNRTVASTVSAEWVRMAYHDMATHNVTDGTGGLDASIFYEIPLNRTENVGKGMTESLNDFVAIGASKYVSRSDAIAAAVVLGVVGCKGPVIPYRGGRIDATGPGLAGVPEPQEVIEKHIDKFKSQGFTQSEMIGLVACGHTLGGVRSDDFPEVVHPPVLKAPPAKPDDANFVQTFDSTDAFDENIVTEYLQQTTRNPLVIQVNPQNNSDQRIFMSDGNATMKSMATREAFFSKCQTLLGKMIDTVPKGVQLGEEIKLMPVKVKQARLSFENRTLFFEARLRLAQGVDKPLPSPNRTVHLLWCDKFSDNKDCKQGKVNSANSGPQEYLNDTTRETDLMHGSVLTTRLGMDFRQYPFLIPINSTRSISHYWFEVNENDGSTPKKVYDNDGEKYSIEQDDTVVALRMGTESSRPGQNSGIVHNTTLVLAVRSSLTPSRVHTHFIEKNEKHDLLPDGKTFAPIREETIEFKLDTTIPPSDGYNFYSANMGQRPSTFDFFATFGNGKVVSIEDVLSGILGLNRSDDVPINTPEIVDIAHL